MSDNRLDWSVTSAPDFGGFDFFVEAGKAFDLDDFCAAYKLNPVDFDVQNVKSCKEAANNLLSGDWLYVTFEEVPE